MLFLKLIFVLYTLIILVFINGSLLLCNDPQLCMFPVPPSSLRTHLGFRIREFYGRAALDFKHLLEIANFVLGL